MKITRLHKIFIEVEQIKAPMTVKEIPKDASVPGFETQVSTNFSVLRLNTNN